MTSSSPETTESTQPPPPEEEVPSPTLVSEDSSGDSKDTMTTAAPSTSPSTAVSVNETPSKKKKSNNDNNDEDEKPPKTLGPILTQARRDLWSAQAIRPLGFLLNPLRTFVWDPSLAIFSILLPPLIPRPVDGCLTFLCIHMTLPVLHFLYPKLDNETDSQVDDNLTFAAKNTLLHKTPNVIALTPPTDIQSAFQGSVSFVVSAIGDVLGAVTNPAKLQGWTKAMAQFNNFLESSGVADELQESLLKPLWRGRLFANLKILNDIQEEHLNMKDRATGCAAGDGTCQIISKLENEDEEKTKDATTHSTEILEGKRLMRFATAAYGTEMIRSALDKEVAVDDLETLHKAISVHTDIREEDVKLVFAEQADTADRHVLHHFVAVDRRSKSIVLALRGTLSLSGAIVDVQGMAVDFCSGKAHQGIAEMAENVWAQSGEFILNLFEENEKEYADYRLLITGHSLGAGTACLLNVKLHYDQVFQKNGGTDREIVCYAFAPPPTFDHPVISSSSSYDTSPSSSPLLQRAIQNTVAYIHDNDVVPFLSIAVVRRLALLLDTVDNSTEFLWFWKRWRIFYEYETIPKDIAERVVEASKAKQRAIDGANELHIPARVVMWCVKKEEEEAAGTASSNSTGKPGAGTFRVVACDPKKVANEHIFLCQDMLTDHLPEQYENALDALVEDTLA